MVSEAATTKLRCGDRVLALGSRTHVMGIVNVTPDSFSDGGAFFDVGQAVAHAERLLAEGADVLDIGGESTRPGAHPVSPEEEVRRVLPVVVALVARGIRNISIDTRNASTAAACLAAGAAWINDVSALQHDPRMVDAVRPADAVVLMHARDMTTGTAGDDVDYVDVVAEVRAFLDARVRHAVRGGLPAARIVVDPGIGFGKRIEDNLALTRSLRRFADLGAGVLYGPSRKRFLGVLTGAATPSERDAATVGAVCLGALHGAHLVRVHDVHACVQALRVVDALRVAQHDPQADPQHGPPQSRDQI